MPKVVAAVRSAIYELYGAEPGLQLGVTEIQIHNYMNTRTGTFLPVEFEDAVNYLMRIGEVDSDQSSVDMRYRLTPEGHYTEEELRLSAPQRWWRDLRSEFGTRLFWLLVGAALAIGQQGFALNKTCWSAPTRGWQSQIFAWRAS